jgi:hypothetical protein
MEQNATPPEKKVTPAVRFSDNWDTADEVVKNGVVVTGIIKDYQETPDPRDDEHQIIHIGYEYEVDGQTFSRELKFSINFVHISYGYEGGLINTPKFKYSLSDFRNSMQAGQTMNIRVLPKSPFWYLVEFNEVMQEIMQYAAVWR